MKNHDLDKVEVLARLGRGLAFENERFCKQHPGNANERDEEEEALQEPLPSEHVLLALRTVLLVILVQLRIRKLN